MLTSMKSFLQQERPRLPQSYFAEFPVDAAALPPPSIDFTDYPGLAFLHVVQDAAGPPRVFTYWLTREQFEYAGTRLALRLGAGDRGGHGNVMDARFRTKPLWRRVSVYTLLLAVVGILSAVKGLADHASWLFSAPELKVAAADNEPIRLVERVPSQTRINIENPLSIAQSDIEIAAFLQVPGKPDLALPVPDGLLRSLPAESSHTIRLPLALSTRGRHAIRLDVRSSAGVLRLSERKRFTLRVDIWPSAPLAVLTSASGVGTTGVLDLRMTSGMPMPAGAECAITISGVPGLGFDGSGADWQAIDTPKLEVATLGVAERRPLPGFTVKTWSFSLQSATPLDWKKLARGAAIICAPRREDIQ